ncbi:hypothetical protein Pmani_005412 [Petrolisthes manimaculis]|uniref:Uncharacterized protein n=1 Tax=Petrolisthes manimaculis TaxID=1843537 RepID=A0AAE1QDX4_9EUCA|nr:hypothetical protein Pmani_005412 [Petrolisthes manimaculis]
MDKAITLRSLCLARRVMYFPMELKVVREVHAPTCVTKTNVDVGPVNVNNHVNCPAGQHFVVQASRCIDGLECNNVCQDGNINWPSKPTTGPGTPTPTTPTTDCINSLVCPSAGYFSMCTYTCQPQYFYCSGYGVPATIQTCIDGNVFNPDPDYPYCILPGNCPGTPTIPTTDCINSLVCPSAGYFSMCTYTCQPQYFYCSGYGVPATIQTCIDGNVFNPDPDYPYCILPGSCPYFPPLL